MKVLSILGSPRKNGNTGKLMEAYVGGIKKTKDINADTIYLQEMSIAPCTFCNGCHKRGDSTCSIIDDMSLVYEKLMWADVIILGTPVYFCNVTAQVKSFIDRLYAVDFKGINKEIRDKKIILLMTYDDLMTKGGPWLIEKILRKCVSYMGLQINDVLSFNINNEYEALAEEARRRGNLL